MQVVLAEKPSVARDIAAVVGAKTKRDGYFEGNGYAVTYAFGHLVRIAEPEDMNANWGKPWRLDVLPMIPENWKYSIADGAKQQFTVIKKLFLDENTDKIICATDAGREGEHIFRLIYKLTGCKKPVDRLWISSLTADAIKAGFKKLKSAQEFNNLAKAASARAHADWLVGLNFTRAYTVSSRQLCTIGRVQTPTLALIVDRQTEIDNFKSATFYEIFAKFAPGFLAKYISSESQPETRLTDKVKAESILDSIKPLKFATVKSVITTEKRSKAPALYDLLTLQKDANKRFGFTAQETLDIAQSLYEQYKIISYPRTESRHISTDMVEELPKILDSLLRNASNDVIFEFDKEGLKAGAITGALLKPRLGKTYVDDTKLTDHHAIIPTDKPPPSDLPDKQQKLYDLIVFRFLCIFLPAEVRDETIAILNLGEHLFRAKGVVLKEPGWTILLPKKGEEEEEEPEEKVKGKKKDKEKDKADEEQKLPAMTANQQVDKMKEALKEGKTTPPKPFDDASLLTAMKNAGQEIDDDDLANYMKQSGLGTPATRAAIIERLLQTAYIERKKKTIVPTEKGKTLIGHVHTELKDVKLTAVWEQRLKDIQDGAISAVDFEKDIAQFIGRVLPVISRDGKKLQSVATMVADSIGNCPKCKIGAIRLSPKGAGCNRWREGCKFMIWREQCGKKLTDNQIQELLEHNETKMLKGFKKKDGSGTFEAKLVLTDSFRVLMAFD